VRSTGRGGDARSILAVVDFVDSVCPADRMLEPDEATNVVRCEESSANFAHRGASARCLPTISSPDRTPGDAEPGLLTHGTWDILTRTGCATLRHHACWQVVEETDKAAPPAHHRRLRADILTVFPADMMLEIRLTAWHAIARQPPVPSVGDQFAEIGPACSRSGFFPPQPS